MNVISKEEVKDRERFKCLSSTHWEILSTFSTYVILKVSSVLKDAQVILVQILCKMFYGFVILFKSITAAE